LKIVHLVPLIGTEADFYGVLVAIARAAAERLGVELEAIDCARDRGKLLENGSRLLGRTPRPDCILLPNYQGAAHELVPLFDAAGIATFVLTEAMTPADRLAHGEPRTKHARWLGELVPDDVVAGQLLARILADEARAKGLVARDGKIHALVLSGDQSPAGQARFHGWLASTRERPEIVQTSVHYASWTEDGARAATRLVLRAHPEVTLIWAANDAMALGAVQGTRDCGREPGRDLLIGGVDLLPRALQCVVDGSMAVTLGGHVLDGARALILLHDHLHGVDFEPWSRRSLLEPVTAALAPRYLHFLGGRGWQQVDFARFSRARSGSAAVPELTIQGLV
jgi:hypothetical protein